MGKMRCLDCDYTWIKNKAEKCPVCKSNNIFICCEYLGCWKKVHKEFTTCSKHIKV